MPFFYCFPDQPTEYSLLTSISVPPLLLPGDPSSSSATSYIAQGVSSGITVATAASKLLTLYGTGKSCGQSTTIHILSDDVLLEIFDFCRNHRDYFCPVWEWHLLAHVCRSWRQLIFASPHRLDLQILCTPRTPVRKNLGIWPAFPIAIDYVYSEIDKPNDGDNVIAALEHPDRVRYIALDIKGLKLEELVTVMQDPFPVLTYLNIFTTVGYIPVLPDEFLGGSTPCLQEIRLARTPFPALPTLLLSARDLVTLQLYSIPPAGYISPEEMVACLAVLPRLKMFGIEFDMLTPQLNRSHPPPIARAILPALTSFNFRGCCGYLEDLVAPIDGPIGPYPSRLFGCSFSTSGTLQVL